jgi:hypothetical protein
MVQFIDKDALVAEIENWKQHTSKCGYVGQGEYEEGNKQGRLDTCEKILSFLNTLEVKEVDLEEKATQLSQKYFPDEYNIWARANVEAQKCKFACIEMIEWFKTQKGE